MAQCLHNRIVEAKHPLASTLSGRWEPILILHSSCILCGHLFLFFRLQGSVRRMHLSHLPAPRFYWRDYPLVEEGPQVNRVRVHGFTIRMHGVAFLPGLW